MAESPSPFSNFMQAAIVVAFAASIVVLGAKEMTGTRRTTQNGRKASLVRSGLLRDSASKHNSVSRSLVRGEEEKKGAPANIRPPQGGEMRAIISKQALRESSGPNKKSDGSIFSGLLPDFGRKSPNHSDNLSSRDRQELDDLLGKVAK